jgi:hypothetical protein
MGVYDSQETRMIRASIAAIVVFLSGCTGAESNAPKDLAVGTYVLTSVNGSSLPYTPPRASLMLEKGFTVTTEDALLSDKYEINSDGTYSEVTSIRDARFSSPREYRETGVWLRTGNTLTLMIRNSPNSSGNYDALLDGSTMTISYLTAELLTYIYVKQ